MSEYNNRPIGIFDSGVGGLTVAKEILKQYPNESFVYFGDTARVPYGSKSRDTIIKYSGQIVNFLKTKDVKAIVVACNTASAYALDTIEKETDIPMIGVVKPGAKVAAATTANKKIGIIGTEGTIKSELYTKYIKSIDNAIEVYGKACPLFCPLVEEGMLDDSVTYEMARRYLFGLKEIGIDSLILGCTHYPLLIDTIKDIMGDNVNLVNPAFETARSLGQMMEKKNLKAEPGCSANYDFYVSDGALKFRKFANLILPFDIDWIEEINIENY